MTSRRIIPGEAADGFMSRRSLLASGLAFSAAACSTPQNIIGVPTNPALTPSDVAERGHRIFVITTRRPSEDPSEFYSGLRSGSLGFAAVDVVIPPSHQPGKVERPRSLPPDPNKHFVITNPETFENIDSFRQEYDRAFLKLPRGQRDGLLWVHGYNNSLTDAVLRLAQFVEDSGYTGVPFLYSWASQKKLTGYVYDMNSALIARDKLETIPEVIAGDSAIDGLDVVAHSMGNLVTMEAIRGVSRRGLFNSSGKLQNVILASPDIDLDLFVSQLRNIPLDERRFFVLSSADDQALRVSRAIARNPRVGQLSADQLAKLGVNAIDLSQVKDTSSVHHTKFVDSPEIVQLLGNRVLAGDTFSASSGIAGAFVAGASGEYTLVDELQ